MEADYGTSHDLPSVSWMETQGGQWCSLQAGEPESLMAKIPVQSVALRISHVEVQGRSVLQLSSLADHSFTLPPPFVLFRPSGNWRRPTQPGEGLGFTQLTHSNANVFSKHSHSHTQKYWLASSLGTCCAVKLTHKTNCPTVFYDPLCGAEAGELFPVSQSSSSWAHTCGLLYSPATRLGGQVAKFWPMQSGKKGCCHFQA